MDALISRECQESEGEPCYRHDEQGYDRRRRLYGLLGAILIQSGTWKKSRNNGVFQGVGSRAYLGTAKDAEAMALCWVGIGWGIGEPSSVAI